MKKKNFKVTIILASIISVLVVKVFLGANVGNLNMKVEKIKYEVIEQEKTNESLIMKVNELTSFDKVNGVARDLGLAYNNDNIIVIRKGE